MLKKLKWIIVVGFCILLLTPIVGFYLLNNGNPIHEFITNRHIPEYLKEQGFSNADLADAHFVAPNHSINKDFYHGHYLVKFKDDTEFTYSYRVTKRGKEVK